MPPPPVAAARRRAAASAPSAERRRWAAPGAGPGRRRRARRARATWRPGRRAPFAASPRPWASRWGRVGWAAKRRRRESGRKSDAATQKWKSVLAITHAGSQVWCAVGRAGDPPGVQHQRVPLQRLPRVASARGLQSASASFRTLHFTDVVLVVTPCYISTAARIETVPCSAFRILTSTNVNKQHARRSRSDRGAACRRAGW